MKLCLLVPGPPASGDAAAEHARRLATDHGVEVTLALCEQRPAGTVATRAGEPRIVAVEDALAGEYDVALASGWTTTVHLFAVPARRHALLVERFEHHHLAPWDPERVGAVLSYDLPVDFVATGAWVASALAELRPDARTLVVRSGVDKELFAPADATPQAGRPLKVVADIREGEHRVRAALGAMAEPHADVLVGPGDGPAARAAALAGADVPLMLADADGALGLPLEGFHMGATTVVSPSGDAGELVRDGENGVVTEPDDPAGAARALDTLARDRARLATLQMAATRTSTAAGWPSWDASAAAMAAALRELLATEPPDASRWPARLMADAMAAIAVLRNEQHATSQELARVRGDEAYRLAMRLRET